ncbi:MAG: CPBP family intramembrane metalloprotease [Planctomycetota bacterium]|nr:CPBP family intramembrane metalloprotease [Planctomycetota bacterium]
MASYRDSIRRFDVSFLCVMPLVFVYILGSVFLRYAPPNGADFFTPLIYHYFGQRGVFVFGLLLLLFSLVIYSRLKEQKSFRADYIIVVFAEGIVFAVIMVFFLSVVIRSIYPVATSSEKIGFAGVLTVSAGAGVWEEMLFRVSIMGGLYSLILGNRKRYKVVAFFVSLFISAVLFSLAHFFAETPTLLLFLYRFFAGVFLGTLYLWRGYGVCAYSHFVFDVLALVFSNPRATSVP